MVTYVIFVHVGYQNWSWALYTHFPSFPHRLFVRQNPLDLVSSRLPFNLTRTDSREWMERPAKSTPVTADNHQLKAHILLCCLLVTSLNDEVLLFRGGFDYRISESSSR